MITKLWNSGGISWRAEQLIHNFLLQPESRFVLKYQSFSKSQTGEKTPHHGSYDGGRKHLWNVGILLPDYTAQQHRNIHLRARRRENLKSHQSARWSIGVIIMQKRVSDHRRREKDPETMRVVNRPAIVISRWKETFLNNLICTHMTTNDDIRAMLFWPEI
jgi:hypothetical protein